MEWALGCWEETSTEPQMESVLASRPLDKWPGYLARPYLWHPIQPSHQSYGSWDVSISGLFDPQALGELGIGHPPIKYVATPGLAHRGHFWWAALLKRIHSKSKFRYTETWSSTPTIVDLISLKSNDHISWGWAPTVHTLAVTLIYCS